MPKRRNHRSSRSHGTRHHLVGADRALKVDARFRRLLGRLDEHGFAWDELADDVLPVFERARPFLDEVEPPAHAIVPPGVTVGFAVDIGPAFARIGVRHLESWPLDLGELTDRALQNLRRRARKARDYDLVAEPIGGVPTVAFQSRDGWASTAILVPEAIDRLFGPGPAMLIAPSRDLLIAMPAAIDVEFATSLAEAFEAEDPNALRLEAFDWRDGKVYCRALARQGVVI